MLFQITCVDGSTYYFDNILTRIYDNLYRLMDFSKKFNTFYNKMNDYHLDARISDYYLYNTESLVPTATKVISSEQVKRLEITLGTKCNYRCKYCIQHNCNHVETVETFNKDLFVERYKELIKRNHLNSIKFTGGEPFVYWDRLKWFISTLRNDLGFQGRVQIVTNGELFDRKKFEFLQENNVHIFFSHDAYAQTHYRHKVDYFKNSEKRSLVIDYLQRGQYDYGRSTSGAVSFIVNPKVYTLELGIDYFCRELYDGVPITCILPTKCDQATKFIYDEWTQDHLEACYSSFMEALLSTKEHKYYNYFLRFKEVLERILYRIVNRTVASSRLSRCPIQVSGKILPCDCNGNIIPCWGSIPDTTLVMGNIAEYEKAQYNFKSLRDYPECIKCPYVVTCGCACPILNKEDHAIRCKSLFPLIRAETEAALSVLLGKRVKEITPYETGPSNPFR